MLSPTKVNAALQELVRNHTGQHEVWAGIYAIGVKDNELLVVCDGAERQGQAEQTVHFFDQLNTELDLAASDRIEGCRIEVATPHGWVLWTATLVHGAERG